MYRNSVNISIIYEPNNLITKQFPIILWTEIRLVRFRLFVCLIRSLIAAHPVRIDAWFGADVWGMFCLFYSINFTRVKQASSCFDSILHSLHLLKFLSLDSVSGGDDTLQLLTRSTDQLMFRCFLLLVILMVQIEWFHLGKFVFFNFSEGQVKMVNALLAFDSNTSGHEVPVLGASCKSTAACLHTQNNQLLAT